MRHLRRPLPMVVLVMLLMVAGRGPVEASSPEPLVVHYVGGDFYVVGPDLAAGVVRNHAGVATAPLGWFDFVAADDAAVITLDDANPLAVVPVVVVGHGRRCVANHGSFEVGGLTPGERVSVWIDAPTWGYGRCGLQGGATVGTATVVP